MRQDQDRMGSDPKDSEPLTLDNIAGELLSLREDLLNWDVGISLPIPVPTVVGRGKIEKAP